MRARSKSPGLVTARFDFRPNVEYIVRRDHPQHALADTSLAPKRLAGFRASVVKRDAEIPELSFR